VKEYVTVVTINDLPDDAGLKPGMTAEVKIMAKTIDDVLLIPVQAVTEREGSHYSYVVNGREVVKKEIKVGENNEKFVEVKEGLTEGEQVALDARARITAEAKAKAAENGAPPKDLPKDEPKTPKSPPAAAPGKPIAAR
jgi:multidrug efflux pump subunit AcrA (membrane-fusion protein)